MQLTLSSLKDLGAFTGAPVRKEITWMQGSERVSATVYVRPPSYFSAINGFGAGRNREDGVAAYIAAAICDEKGQPVFTPADITGEADPEQGPLSGEITVALLKVIGEVGGLGKQPAAQKPKPKRLARKKSSGASSSLPASVDTP